MFSIELITFSLLLAIFYRLRALKPHWFVPLCGLSIFCPPTEEDISEWKKEKEKIMKGQGKNLKVKPSNVKLHKFRKVQD